MIGNFSDPYSFAEREPYYLIGSAGEEQTIADAERILEDASETRALGSRACDATIAKIASGEVVEPARENWDLDEYTVDDEDIVSGAINYIAGESKK